jgi:hypothetical protein
MARQRSSSLRRFAHFEQKCVALSLASDPTAVPLLANPRPGAREGDDRSGQESPPPGVTQPLISPLDQQLVAERSNIPAAIFRLNLQKSEYHPGPPPKTLSVAYQERGPDRRATAVGIDAEGNPYAIVFMEMIEDGKPHPVAGTSAYDTSTYTRVDAYAVNFSRMKTGKVVQIGAAVMSQDGNTNTITTTGIDANERQFNNIEVLEKQ